MLDAVAESLEKDPSVGHKVGDHLGAVEKAPVALLKLERDIPVEYGNQRRDILGDEGVEQVGVVFDSRFVDRVVSTSWGVGQRSSEGRNLVPRDSPNGTILAHDTLKRYELQPYCLSSLMSSFHK